MHIHFRHEASFHFVDEERGTQLYRIVQEALMNAVKHAKCSRIDVRLSVDRTADGPSRENNGGNQGILTIEVVDNGIGFPANVPDNGMGLRIMRYRAEMAEAALTVSNLDPPAKGTRVTCTFS